MACAYPINLCNSLGLGLSDLHHCTWMRQRALARVSNKLPLFASCIVLEAFSLPAQGFGHRAQHLPGRFFTTEPPGKCHRPSAYSQMYVTTGSKLISWDVWWQSGLRRSSGLKVQRVEEGECSLEKVIRDGLFKELQLSKDLYGGGREPRDDPGRGWHSGPWNQE